MEFKNIKAQGACASIIACMTFFQDALHDDGWGMISISLLCLAYWVWMAIQFIRLRSVTFTNSDGDTLEIEEVKD